MVVCFEVIRHLENYQKVIEKMHRVARRMVLFTVEVCEGPSIYSGEDRYGSYLAGSGKDQFLHYQIEHCASDFINWLRMAYPYNMDLRTITNSKYAFALHKLQRGLSFAVTPVDGMQRLEVELLKCIRHLGRLGTELRLTVNVGSIRPLSLMPIITMEEKDAGTNGEKPL
jgi:hypothetical protein